jgi:hypothetical protein
MDGVKETTTGMGGWMNKEVGTQERVLVDLHLHSRASGTASNWWVRGLGAGAEALSGDAFVAEIVDVAVRQFYERCTAVAVPSQATALALRNRGYRISRFEILKNGVDKELFTPEKRDLALHDALGGGRSCFYTPGG